MVWDNYVLLIFVNVFVNGVEVEEVIKDCRKNGESFLLVFDSGIFLFNSYGWYDDLSEFGD